jgi:hypothetical protein
MSRVVRVVRVGWVVWVVRMRTLSGVGDGAYRDGAAIGGVGDGTYGIYGMELVGFAEWGPTLGRG